MFGLDARIALAIFGALSLISGASLYGAIKHSQAVSMLSDMNEMGKAWDAYYLDTGRYIPYIELSNTASDSFYRGTTKDLIEDTGVKGWAGPYLPYGIDGNSAVYPKGRHVHMLTLTDDATWSSTDWRAAKCVAGKKCHMWIYINAIEGDTMAKEIDNIIDGGDGALVGNFRYYDSGDPTWKYSYLLKYAPMKNPHD
jgi:hypothetical protein